MQAKGKVLVIEDAENWRIWLQRLLCDESGFIVETATNFDEAQSVLQRQLFDLAVVDIRLDDSIPDDVQMERTLREVYKYGDDTGVITLTAHGTSRLTRDALLRYGVTDFMEKDPESFDTDQFLAVARRTVQNTLDRRAMNPPRFDVSIRRVTLELLVKELLPQLNAAYAARELKKFLNELFHNLLPLSQEGIKLEILSKTPRLASIWCWSRRRGEAVVVELKEYDEEDREILKEQLAAKRQVVTEKSLSWFALKLSGTVYTLSNMPFADFLAKLEENRC